MLGWEYPPYFSGGLGVACKGLAEALSASVALTVVLPKKPAEASLPKGRITEIPEQTHTAAAKHARKKLRLEVVETTLFPYPGMYRTFAVETKATEPLEIDSSPIPTEISSNPSEAALYGDRLLERLLEYAEGVKQVVAPQADFDLIHAHDWVTFPAALELQKKLRIPLVVHIHSLETDRVQREIRNKVFEIEYKAMKAADMVIAVSQYTRDLVVKDYSIPLGKVFVVHNGIGKAPIQESGQAVPTAQRPQKVLFLGRITRQKGPTFLVETAVQLLKKLPYIQFVVAGTGESLRAVMLYAKERNVFSRFTFTGFASPEQVQQLYREADVYFMPSVSEPFGLTALEAAQSGLPVVLSNQSGVRELLTHSPTADFWDTQGFAEQLYQLLTNPQKRQELAQLNKETAAKATWERAAEDMLLHYQRLLNGRQMGQQTEHPPIR